MTLCLDSSIVIDLLQGRRDEVRRRYEHARSGRQELLLPTLALSELSFGIQKGEPARRAGKLERLDELLSGLTVVDFDADDALVAGRVRAELPKGRSIGAIDVLIAAQAIARGWTVVTSNVRHFGLIAGLPIIDWRMSDRRMTPEDIITRLRGGTKDR